MLCRLKTTQFLSGQELFLCKCVQRANRYPIICHVVYPALNGIFAEQ